MKITKLQEQRNALVSRAASQREDLAYYWEPLNKPLATFDQGLAVARSLRRSPVAVAGITAVLTRTPWKKYAKLPKLLWSSWLLYRLIRSTK